MRLPVHALAILLILLWARWSAGQSDLTTYQSPLFQPIEAIPHRNRLIEHALDREVNVNFDKTPLHEAIAKLSVMAGTDIFLDPGALQVAQVEREHPVTLTVQGISIRSALVHILEPLQLTFFQTAERWSIVDSSEAAAELRTAVYPIADLEQFPPGSGRYIPNQLMDLIQGIVANDTWADNGGTGSIDYLPSTKSFVITQTPNVHKEIEELLVALRAARDFSYDFGSQWTAQRTAIFVGMECHRLLNELLERKIDVDFQKTPLRAALEKLSVEAGTEILIDSKGFQIALVEPETPITLKVSNTSIRSVLQLVLDPQQLVLVQFADRWLATDTTETAQRLLTRVYPVADLILVSGTDVDQIIAAQFMACIQGTIATDTWADNGGTGTMDYFSTAFAIVVTQTSGVHDQLHDLLLSLRKARQYRYDVLDSNDAAAPYPAIFVGQERHLDLERSLDRRVDVDFRGMPLDKVLEQFAEAAKTAIILDQKGLLSASVEPNVPITLQAHQITLRSALSLILEPLRLSLASVADHWKVTDQWNVEASVVTRVYPIADLACLPTSSRNPDLIANQIMFLLQGTVATDTWQDNGGTGSIDYLPTTMSLIVTQTSAVHSELANLFLNLRIARRAVFQSQVQESNRTALKTSLEKIRPPVRQTSSFLQRSAASRSELEPTLNTRVSVDFERLPFRDAVMELRRLGIPIVVHPESLQSAGSVLNKPISLRMNDVAARNVAYWTARTAGWRCVYGQTGQQVYCDSEQEPFVRAALWETLIDRNYDLAPLLFRRHDAKPIFNQFMAMLQGTVASDTWEDNGGIAAMDGNGRTQILYVRQTAELHGLLEGLFGALRQSQFYSPELETKSWLPDLEKARQQSRSTELMEYAQSAAHGRLRYRPGCLASLPMPANSVTDSAPYHSPSVSFASVPLADAVEMLRRITGANIHIDPRGLEELRITANQPVSVSTSGERLHDILTAMLEPIELAFTPIHDVLRISSQGDVWSNLTTRVYPIADLVVDRGIAPVRLMAELQRVDEDYWADNGGIGSIDYFPSAFSLVVTQSQPVHRHLEARLWQIRNGSVQ